MTPALSSTELAQLVEMSEGEAYAKMFHAAAGALSVRAERVGSAIVLIAPDYPIILFNRVIGLGVQEPASETMVDEIVALYRSAGVTRYAVQVNPSATPTILPTWLNARGFQRRDNWAKVYRPALPPVEISTNLHIRVIGQDDADLFAQVACSAFGMPGALTPMLTATIGQPGWRHYLAFDGNPEAGAVGAQAVATAALHVQEGVGWLGIGSTLPSHRRRGAQGALMARRIQDGAALGCRWLVTETGEDTEEQPNSSYHNMMRSGFALAFLRANYMCEGSNSVTGDR